DKWLVDEVVISIVVPRPDAQEVEQHMWLARGYDFPDGHPFIEQERYVAPIKHRRQRGEPILEDCPIPGETQFPARRWVVQRPLGWLAKFASALACVPRYPRQRAGILLPGGIQTRRGQSVHRDGLVYALSCADPS